MAYRQQKLHLAVNDIGVRKGRETQQTVCDDRDVDITSIRFFQTDLVASFHHCVRVVKPAADDDGVLKNVMETASCCHRRFFEITNRQVFHFRVFRSRVFSAPDRTHELVASGTVSE